MSKKSKKSRKKISTPGHEKIFFQHFGQSDRAEILTSYRKISDLPVVKFSARSDQQKAVKNIFLCQKSRKNRKKKIFDTLSKMFH